MNKIAKTIIFIAAALIAIAAFYPVGSFASSGSHQMVRIIYYKDKEKIGEVQLPRDPQTPLAPPSEGTEPGLQGYLKPEGYHVASVQEHATASALESAYNVVYEPDIAYNLEYRQQGTEIEIISGSVFSRSDTGALLKAGDIIKVEAVDIPGFALIGDKERYITISEDVLKNRLVFYYNPNASYAYSVEYKGKDGRPLHDSAHRSGLSATEAPLFEKAIEIYGYAPTALEQKVQLGPDGKAANVLFTYELDPALWDKLIFDPQDGTSAAQVFYKLAGMPISKYNALEDKAAYPKALPQEPNNSGWRFAGWYSSSSADAAKFNPSGSDTFTGGAAFFARYEKEAQLRFAIDPDGTGAGTINGGTQEIVIIKTLTRFSESMISEAMLERKDIPECAPKSNSRFAGWKGSNASGDKWSSTFKDGDVNFARFDMLLSVSPPSTSDKGELFLYFWTGIAAATLAFLVIWMAKKRASGSFAK